METTRRECSVLGSGGLRGLAESDDWAALTALACAATLTPSRLECSPSACTTLTSRSRRTSPPSAPPHRQPPQPGRASPPTASSRVRSQALRASSPPLSGASGELCTSSPLEVRPGLWLARADAHALLIRRRALADARGHIPARCVPAAAAADDSRCLFRARRYLDHDLRVRVAHHARVRRRGGARLPRGLLPQL